MYPVCASSNYAQPNQNPASYGTINSTGTTFPGSSNNTEFADNSIPSAYSWAGRPTNRPILNITEVDSFISFSYKGRPDYVFQVPPAYRYDIKDEKHFADHYTNISIEDVGVRWERIQEFGGQNNGDYAIQLRSYYNADGAQKEHYLFIPAFYLYRNYEYSFKIDYKI